MTTAICECCGREIKRVVMVRGATLGVDCAQGVRDCLAYLRDSRAFPDMYPADRLRSCGRHSVAVIRMAEEMMR
jgi:ribosome-binding protein aMBF1 (putative translation factor)